MTQKEIECAASWQIYEAEYYALREYWRVMEEHYNDAMAWFGV